MSDIFKVSAKAVLYFGDEILLVRKPNGQWDLPGGRLDAGETPQTALIREAAEELAIPIKVGDLAHCEVRKKKNTLDIFVAAYICSTKASPDDVELSHEHEKFKLVKPAKLNGIDMEEVFKKAIKRAEKIRKLN